MCPGKLEAALVDSDYKFFFDKHHDVCWLQVSVKRDPNFAESVIFFSKQEAKQLLQTSFNAPEKSSSTARIVFKALRCRLRKLIIDVFLALKMRYVAGKL